MKKDIVEKGNDLDRQQANLLASLKSDLKQICDDIKTGQYAVPKTASTGR